MKTKVTADKEGQDIVVVRTFDAPINLLFRAFTEAEIFEQWMGTKTIKYDCRPYGSYRFETLDPSGKVVFSANGTFHEVIPDSRITRTFEMENSTFPVQLEFLEFNVITQDTSKLTMQIVFKSKVDRNNLLELPFEGGINMAHNRLQDICNNLKT